MMEAKEAVIRDITVELAQLTQKYEQAQSKARASEPAMAELKRALESEAARLASELAKYKQAYSELWVDTRSASRVAVQLRKQV